jgi:hypothetical protein
MDELIHVHPSEFDVEKPGTVPSSVEVLLLGGPHPG